MDSSRHGRCLATEDVRYAISYPQQMLDMVIKIKYEIQSSMLPLQKDMY